MSSYRLICKLIYIIFICSDCVGDQLSLLKHTVFHLILLLV